MNSFSHIDLRVRNLAEAETLYRALLPPLGFKEFWEGEDWKGFSADEDFPGKAFFAFTEDPAHRANGTRIAFWTSSAADVDKIAAAVLAAGAQSMEGPCFHPEYDPSYYAIFFEDPSGNKLEVVHRRS
jgi:catechol 2,3-dioxygenase-like lactoylglutathione lyase family enzyme